MEQKDFLIQEMNFTKTTERTFSSGQYYQILLLSKGECYFEFENNFVYCNTETAIFLKPEQKIRLQYHHNRYPLVLLSVLILPEYLSILSDETCDLGKSFDFVPVEKSMIHLDTRDTTLLKNITKTIPAEVQGLLFCAPEWILNLNVKDAATRLKFPEARPKKI